jgi:hypothetical protein
MKLAILTVVSGQPFEINRFLMLLITLIVIERLLPIEKGG